MTPKLTPGRRLRADMEALLERTREDMHEPDLASDERELDIVARAAAAADRAGELRAVFDSELSGEARPAVLCKVSAEIRACDKAVVELVARLSPTGEPVKSERHQRAANSRYGRVNLRSV